jgi:hypothetical protein
VQIGGRIRKISSIFSSSYPTVTPSLTPSIPLGEWGERMRENEERKEEEELHFICKFTSPSSLSLSFLFSHFTSLFIPPHPLPLLLQSTPISHIKTNVQNVVKVMYWGKTLSEGRGIEGTNRVVDKHWGRRERERE